MKWLMGFLVECYQAAPAHLNVQIPQHGDPLLVHPLEAEADELCSFVGKKANKESISNRGLKGAEALASG
jgi:hypothetical protein